MNGRGVWCCISPWNFPLAIFTGQIVAALVAGNCVIAKPATQTPKIAALAVRLAHEAGVPPNVLHIAIGGAKVGGALGGEVGVAGRSEEGRVGEECVCTVDKWWSVIH